jgi:hypothetical protein
MPKNLREPDRLRYALDLGQLPSFGGDIRSSRIGGRLPSVPAEVGGIRVNRGRYGEGAKFGVRRAVMPSVSATATGRSGGG